MTNKKSTEILPNAYFKELKEKLVDIDINQIKEDCDLLVNLIEDAKEMGQIDLVENYKALAITLVKERILHKNGYSTYVKQEDIERFILNVKDKVVKICELEKFPRTIPTEVKNKFLFDTLFPAGQPADLSVNVRFPFHILGNFYFGQIIGFVVIAVLHDSVVYKVLAQAPAFVFNANPGRQLPFHAGRQADFSGIVGIDMPSVLESELHQYVKTFSGGKRIIFRHHRHRNLVGVIILHKGIAPAAKDKSYTQTDPE